MGMEMVEIGVQFRKLAILSIRKCYILVCNHPFLVGILLFLFFLYRSFPFLFSLLVSTSPVLVCTAFLLGFLLSLGDPNIPDIENEESVNHEIVSLRTEVQRDATVVERNERDGSFVVERYSGTNSSVNGVDGGLVDSGPLIEDYFTETKPERGEIDGESHDPTDTNERKNDETVFLENQYSRIEEMDEEIVGLLDEKSPFGSIESDVAERGDSPPASPWKQFGEGDDDVAGDDVADAYSDSSSDQAESSSPDASMADILPLLDELHPLLNEETPLISHGSDHGSNHSSHRSRGYKEIPNDSDEESETHDDVDDEEERDGMGDAKDDESKPEITWTEDDQKNLMDLGTLELERNQRLESLIARRRARKLMVEKNLIDLNYDLPFTVAPISTSRKNPFDLPYDSNENTGLPPIPGSAPSIMSQRRNPFDLPYDSSEEKPDLTTDSFQQEFSPLPSRETMFRRHESFNIGPSIFAPPRFDRDDFRFRPYFVPEGSSHSSFQRQTSELSDISKISSVLETESESVCSIEEQDDKKLAEEAVLEDVEVDDKQNDEEDVEMDDKKIVGEDVEMDDKKIVDEDVEMGSDLEDPSELVGHGSESSEDEDVTEVRKFEESEVPTVSLTKALSTIEEVHYSSGSSSSSFSEEHERAFDEKKHELSTNLELEIDKVNEQTDETKEPVYDLSPSSVRKNLSCSSISSDLLVEQTSEMDKTVVSFSDRQIDFCNESSTSGVTDKAGQILDHGLSENNEKVDECEDNRVETLARNDVVEEHLFSEDVLLQENEDQIHSLSSNPYSKWVSVEKPMDELHSFDKPVANLSAEDHEELLEPPAVHLASIAEDHDEDGTLCSDHNLEQATVQEQNFLEEGQEIQETDEGLLMELDNVGDFGIGELRTSLNELPPVEDIDSILLRTEPVPMKNEAEISSRMLVFEAEEDNSGVDESVIEEIKADYSQIGTETENNTVVESIHYDEIDSAVHKLEGTSLQDIDTACEQIINDEKLPENIEAEVAEIGEETEDKTVFELIRNEEIDSGMHELEATSLEDIDTSFKQIIDDENPIDIESLPEKTEAEVAEIGERTENKSVFEPILYDAVNSEMHELEARSIQDIDTYFKQKNDDENPMIADSVAAEAEVAEIDAETKHQSVSEIDSGMHELEAASIQDIDSAFRQISDKKIEKPVMQHSLDSESLPEKVDTEVSEIWEETANNTVFEPNLYEEIDSAMHELEATSVEDINTAFMHINQESEKPDIVQSVHAEPLPEKNEPEVAETSEEIENITVFEPMIYDEKDSGMHELEATSVEDINTAFRQLNQGQSEKSIIVESLDVELTENSQAEVAETSEKIENKIVFDPTHYDKIESGMHELEAISVEDINTAFRQLTEGESEKPTIVESLNAELTQKSHAEVFETSEEIDNKIISDLTHYDEIDSGMHELEATSVEDINTAFRQVNEEEIGEANIVEPLDTESSTEKIEAEVSAFSEESENKTVIEPILYDEIGSEMHELEATSVQDINTAFGQLNEGDIGKPAMVESLEAESLPEKIEAEMSDIEAPVPQIAEARFNEDKHMDIKQDNVLERYSSSLSEFFESHNVEAEDKTEFFEAYSDDTLSQNDELENSAVLEPIQEEEINSGMEQLEAQSLEDLNSAFRQIKENFENPIIVESLEAVDVPEKSEAGVFELGNDKPDTIEANDQAEEISSVKHEVDSKLVKDIDTSASQIKEAENKAVFGEMHAEEIQTGMKEFEVRSLEDLRSAFRQIDEKEIETSVTVASLETDFVPEKSEVGFSELERPELPVVEARSIDDIGLAFQQVHNIEKFSNSLSESDKPDIVKADDQAEEINHEMLEPDAHLIKDGDATSSSIMAVENPAVFEPNLAESADVESKDLEARLLEDIVLTSRPVKEQVLENFIFAESHMADLAPEKSEAGVSEIETRNMPVVEASPTEDIGLAFKQGYKSEKNSSPILENINPLILEKEDQEKDINSKMSEIDVQLVEIVDAEFGLIKEVEKPAVFEPVSAETIESETKVFEARSLEDINLTFRHIKDEEVESPVSIATLISDLVPDKSEAEVSEFETECQTQETTQMVEDVDTSSSFDQINKVPNTSDLEPAHSEEITSGLKELEAQSLEDIESAFRQFKVEETEKPTVFESLKAKAEISETGSTQNEPNLEEKSKARSFEYVFIDKPSIETEDSLEPCLSLQVESETKPNSIQEIDKLENRLKSKTENESVGTKTNDSLSSEVVETSIKDPIKAQQISGDFSAVESSVEISSLPETSTGAKEIEPKIKVPSVPLESDGLSSSFSDGKDKKKGKSSKSKSGSSSSSSSSSSDSD